MRGRRAGTAEGARDALAGALDAGVDGGDRRLDGGRDLLQRQLLDLVEDERGALLLRQGAERRVEARQGLAAGRRVLRINPVAELKYRYLKWKMNQLRKKFDVHQGGKGKPTVH